MRKKVIITLAVVVGLVAVALLGVLFWYQRGGLDDWFERRMKADLAEMNIRMEVEGVSISLRPGKVVLTNVELYTPVDAPETAEPFASVGTLTAEFEVTSLWARAVDIKSLALERPVVTVRFDDEGNSNLDPIDLPDTQADTEQQLTYLMATVRVADGQVNYGDVRRRFEGTVDNLAVSLEPKTRDDNTLYHRLTASFEDSRLAYEGRPVENIDAELAADVTREGATVEKLELRSPLGSATIAGRVTDWRELAYELEVGSTVALDRIGAVADPNAGLAGTASLDGTISGSGESYRFDGELTGNNVLVAGVRVAGFSADGKLQGERLDYGWAGRLIASRLTGAGFDVSDIRFDGEIKGSGADAAAEGDLRAARVAGDDFAGTGLTFSGRADLGARAASGDVTLTSMAVRTVRVGSIRARVTAEEDVVDLESFSAVVYGGSVTGSARARLGGGGASSLEAEFRGVDVDQALGAAAADAPRVRGRASGTVNLTWPGTNLQAATGTVRADVDGTVPSEEGGALPLEGQVALTAVPGSFRVDRAEFTSGESRVEVTGTIGWNRRADLDVLAEANDTSDLIALVSAANPIVAETLAENNVDLGGAFRFEGNVSGALTNPELRGQVEIGSVAVGDENLGSFSGSVSRLASELRLEGGTLRNPEDGSEIAFDFTLPARATDLQRVTATVTRVPLTRLFRASPLGVPPAVEQFGGTITGTLDLQLPQGGGISAIAQGARGTVDVAIAGATIGGEPVRDFRVRANLGETLVEVPDLRIETAAGALDGSVVFDKRTSEYRAEFEAENVDLAIARQLQPGLAVSGRGSGTLTVTGRLEGDEHRLTNLAANVTGTDVVVNGQAIGEPRFTVDTAGDVATVRLAADILGARRELAGTIRINDEGQPFEFATTLENFDAVPYAPLAGVTDVPAGVATDITGRVRVAGYLSPPDGGPIAESLQISGDFSELALTAAVDAAGRSYSLANRGNVVFTSTGAAVRFEQATFTGEGTEVTLSGELALAPTASSNLTLSGDVNLALLSSFVPDAYAAGIATIQATVTGPRESPAFSGFADLRDVSLRVVDLPIAIQNGQGRVLFTANQALIDSFTAQSNGGRVRVDGGVLFAGLRPARWRFGIDASQIRVTYPDEVRSIIDGQLALQGNPQLQVLSGTVDVRRAEYTEDVDFRDLLNLDQQTQTTTIGGGPSGPASPIRLDLQVEARDSLIVRNNLADVVASASLSITGPLNDPVVEGRATVARGTIQFRNDEYQVSRGVVRFPGRLGDITFDIQAESEIRGYRVTVGLAGTPSRPYPVLRSDPPLPETQVASLVLTGDLGATEVSSQALAQSGVGLASSLLSEAVSRSVEERTSRLFGINRFQIDPLVGGTDPSARLTIGRQVNKNLSIIYSTNITSSQEQVIQVEYRISDRFSVVATREEDGAFGIDFRVRKRF